MFTCRSNRSSAAASTLSTSGAMGLSEKTFLNPKKMTASKEIRDEKGPSLDDFDKEIEIYQVCSIKVLFDFLYHSLPCRLMFKLTVTWTQTLEACQTLTCLGCLHCSQQTNCKNGAFKLVHCFEVMAHEATSCYFGKGNQSTASVSQSLVL